MNDVGFFSSENKSVQTNMSLIAAIDHMMIPFSQVSCLFKLPRNLGVCNGVHHSALPFSMSLFLPLYCLAKYKTLPHRANILILNKCFNMFESLNTKDAFYLNGVRK